MIAAIDLGGTRTKFGLLDGGSVVAASSCDADAQGSIGNHLGEVLDHLQELCAGQQTTLESCAGLGLLSTGLVDNRAMRVLSTNAKYDDAVDFDFPRWARDHAGLELRMDNDARGALIGEWRYGAGRGVDNLVMITIGTGIGTAVITEGRPLTGPHFSGGNLGGHIIVRSGGRKCTCGGVGCLETEASGWVLPAWCASTGSTQTAA
jgi:glucokinase